MSDAVKANIFSELRRVIWPIEWHENKKFIPMALMMFCILLNYSTLRSIKDGFIVVGIGAEALSFLKLYAVLPSAILAMIGYIKLCNVMSPQKVFYTTTTFFIGYLALFTFFLYPYHEVLHPNSEYIKALSEQYPNVKWFIKIGGKWIFATFYVISELWGSVMLSLLFWQFANQITKSEEAKRFYSTFGFVGNFALPTTSFMLRYFLSKNGDDELKFIPILIIIMASSCVVMFLYAWINKNVLTDPRFYDANNGGKSKKSKPKLSVGESIKMILTSKYLGLIACLVLSYGISINIVEGLWKAKIRQLYTTQESYTMFMGDFQAWQGVGAILFMIIGANILRRVSWGTAAILTPLMILVTGLAFFGFVFFDDNVVTMYLTGILGVSPLVLAVVMGTVQNVLSKATKYSLFDSTKEMAYIPLDDEMKTKGKAGVDVVGGRLGKSGGGIIQSTFFIIFPSLHLVDNEAISFFACVFFVIVIAWVYSVISLNKEYTKQVNASKNTAS